jgi:regulator of sigma E protease
MTAIFTTLAAILIFALLIFVHELGHFIAAKLSGVRVLEFALGMGPRLCGFTRGETRYSVRALPVGGYCAMEGEDAASDDERAFSNKSGWKRFFVLVSGAAMNLLLGFILLLLVNAFSGQIATTEIGRIVPDSPAAQAGLEAGDELLAINGHRTRIINDVLWALSRAEGQTEITARKAGGGVFTVRPTLKTENGRATLGFLPARAAPNFGLVLRQSVLETAFYSKVIVVSLLDLLRGRVDARNMSGPIGMVSEINAAVEQSAESGWSDFSYLAALTILLTVNLGVFNLLPIPALDGGRILFLLVEAARRKRIPPEKEGAVHLAGFALLILLSLFVAYNDVIKLW